MKILRSRYPHTLGFVALALLLGAPFVLKTIAPALEPYPAIILPSGSGKVSLADDRFLFNRLDLFAIDADTGEETRLDPAKFLSPLPLHYLHAIAQNEFGLNEDPTLAVRFKYLRFPAFDIRRSPSDDERRREATAWMQQRLIAANCDPLTLIVRRRSYSVNLADKTTAEENVYYEKVFRLD